MYTEILCTSRFTANRLTFNVERCDILTSHHTIVDKQLYSEMIIILICKFLCSTQCNVNY